MPLTNLTNLALAPAATRARAQPACRPAMRSNGQAVQPVVTIREALAAGDVQAVVTSLQSVTAAGMETAAVDTGPRSRGWARSYAALKMVVEAMEVHVDVAAVQAQGMAALNGIVTVGGGAAYTDAIVAVGAVDAIVAGMLAHVDDTRVQENGMGVLHSIASRHNSNDELRVAAVVAGGGVAAVVVGMIANEAVAVVQQAGSKALCSIACYHANDITEAGGIDAIVAGMDANPDVPGVQDEGYKALSSIANTSCCAVAVMEAGGLRTILAPMFGEVAGGVQHSGGSDAAIRLSMECLSVLAKSGEACAAEVVAGGGVEAAVAGMRAYQGDAEIQVQGIGALWGMSESAHKDAVVAAGGLAVIVEGMRTCAESGEVQRDGNSALKNIAEGSDERRDAVHRAVLTHAGGEGTGASECAVCMDDFVAHCGPEGRALQLPCGHT
jgi:hypothetical protein